MVPHGDKTPRREFIGSLATGAVTLGIAALGAPIGLHARANSTSDVGDADAWLDKVKDKKHRVVFDVTKPHGVFPFAWPFVYLNTNEATGSPASDCGVVVILRHDAIGYAMKDELWAKYKLGELFHAEDPVRQTPAAERNPFWNPKTDDFQVPGIGSVPIGINNLMERGVMFGVCDVALTVYSSALAGGMNVDAAALKKEWVDGLIPGVKIMPSGVWAVGRAQEKGCAYIFAS
ncbi:MAG: hypothetical protein DIU61_013730 [Bacteroidota bacterium]